MVEWKASSTCHCTPGPVVPHSKPSTAPSNNFYENGTYKFSPTKFRAIHHSFKMVFIKHAAVLDQLCNHKQAVTDWSTSQPAECCCKNWGAFKTAAHIGFLAGSLLQSLVSEELAVIAEESLLNKVFPSKKEYHNQLRQGLQFWTKRNGLPSMPKFPRFRTCAKNSGQSIQNRSRAILPNPPSTNSKKPLKVPSSIAKTNNHHPCASTARASTTNPSNKHSKILPFSNQCPMTQLPLCHHLSRPSKNVTENPITGQLATDDNFRRVTSWQNGKKTFEAADPFISFVDSPFRPMLNIQLIPVACPNHFASGDVYTLLTILKSAPVDADFILSTRI